MPPQHPASRRFHAMICVRNAFRRVGQGHFCLLDSRARRGNRFQRQGKGGGPGGLTGPVGWTQNGLKVKRSRPCQPSIPAGLRRCHV